jgi:hypothetical protein
MATTSRKFIGYFSLIALLCTCGGGGGGSVDRASGNSVAQRSTSVVNLSWSMPQRRENGEPLEPAEIQGCVIVTLQQQQLENQQTLLLDLIPSEQAFSDGRQQLNRFINGTDLAAIISTGQPEAVAIYSSEQTSFRFEDMGPGTYHFAVSCFDWDTLYSSLSNTISKTL